ncbi:hypothetical protein GCM10023094_16370 [Rhodococcus olei]|uniref:Uncharacterized protein n=1 Tax=Rhodococcus olei TaxID=2161675 RepID=A0ABP8NWT8_9NOCA
MAVLLTDVNCITAPVPRWPIDPVRVGRSRGTGLRVVYVDFAVPQSIRACERGRARPRARAGRAGGDRAGVGEAFHLGCLSGWGVVAES